jgi:membrane protein DedA with SNARE-associated domain
LIRDLVANVSGYPGLLLFCATSGIVMPLPEDFSLIYAGVRIRGGQFQWLPTLLVAIVGVGIRDVVAFGIGHTLGGWLLHRGWMRRLVGGARLDRAEAMVREHGPHAVLMGRFFIGFRAPVFLVAGATGVSLRSFVLWDGLGLLLAVPATVGLGYAFGEPLAELSFWLVQRAQLVMGGLLALGVAWLAYQRLRRDPPEAEV